jgi:hypothetical protein
MKRIQYKLIVALGLLTGLLSQAQEFKTPLSRFEVENKATVSIEASYTEIEIEEWNKNLVEIQGIMTVEGVPEPEARAIFEAWKIEAENSGNEVSIEAKSNHYGNDYFFIHNDKYIGNVVVDIPEISAKVLEALDSIQLVLPEITEFPDMDFDFDFDMDLDYESLNFDYDAFKKDSKYLKEWQERNKEQLQRLKAKLKKSHLEEAAKQKEMQKKIIIQEKAAIEKHAREMEKEARRMEMEMREREFEIQKILEKRQKIKVKRTLKVKVPKNAKLELDVDYCKITTVN